MAKSTNWTAIFYVAKCHNLPEANPSPLAQENCGGQYGSWQFLTASWRKDRSMGVWNTWRSETTHGWEMVSRIDGDWGVWFVIVPIFITVVIRQYVCIDCLYIHCIHMYVDIYIYIMMRSKGNHPQMIHFQVSEWLQSIQIHVYYPAIVDTNGKFSQKWSMVKYPLIMSK